MKNKMINIEHAKIVYRNFSGVAGKYNAEGNRNFCVVIEQDLADVLIRDGWNVRYLQPREEGDAPAPYIQVKVNFGNRPPKVVLIGKSRQSLLNEETVGLLDWAEIENVDVVINPSPWSVGANSGVKGYLKSIYVTIVEDAFESKYVNAPDSGTDVIGGCGNCEACTGDCGCGGH